MPDVIPLILMIAGGVLLLALLGLLGRLLFDNPRGDFESGVLWRSAQLYAALLHRLRVRGRRHIPGREDAGRLLVVSNHTAGLDPVLIQAACPFFIRWVMAEDMRAPQLEWFWRFWRIIFIDRKKAGARGLMEAARELKRGGVIGIFPEGGLERPPRQIMPFREGAGLLIKKARCRVLPVVVEGTPQVDPAWASLWRPSTSVIHFHAPIDYSKTDLDAAGIAADLRRRFLDYTGWPANEKEPDWAAEAEASPYGETLEAVERRRRARDAASDAAGEPTARFEPA